jgi:hypothetical protein
MYFANCYLYDKPGRHGGDVRVHHALFQVPKAEGHEYITTQLVAGDQINKS